MKVACPVMFFVRFILKDQIQKVDSGRFYVRVLSWTLAASPIKQTHHSAQCLDPAISYVAS